MYEGRSGSGRIFRVYLGVKGILRGDWFEGYEREVYRCSFRVIGFSKKVLEG